MKKIKTALLALVLTLTPFVTLTAFVGALVGIGWLACRITENVPDWIPLAIVGGIGGVAILIYIFMISYREAEAVFSPTTAEYKKTKREIRRLAKELRSKPNEFDFVLFKTLCVREVQLKEKLVSESTTMGLMDAIKREFTGE